MILQNYFQFVILIVLLSCFINRALSDYPNYTYDEKVAIDKLRPMIADYLIPDYMKTDSYHLRVLKVAKFDLNRAFEMVKKTSKWRKNNNIDKILNEDLSAYSNDLPMEVSGVDRTGSPIMQLEYGKWNLRKYGWSGNPEFYGAPIKIFTRAFEEAERQIYEIQNAGQNVSMIYSLADFDGYSIAQHACLQCLSLTAELIRVWSYYPSISKKVVAINAPRIFSQVLELVNEIEPQLLQVISLYGYERNAWERDILHDVSEEQIPKIFGGTGSN